MAYHYQPFGFNTGQPLHHGIWYQPQFQPAFSQVPIHQDMMQAAGPWCVDNEYTMPAMYVDESFEDAGEVATRPRLTKDQVDLLESEFSENPKPSSSHKRLLAEVTKLTLSRVANWFQNRRAKAKQQRKQEEYESNQHKSPTSKEDSDDDADDDGEEDDIKVENGEKRNDQLRNSSQTSQPRTSLLPTTEMATSGDAYDNMRQKGFASLDRALANAEAAKSSQWSATSEQSSHLPLSFREQSTSSSHSSSGLQLGPPIQTFDALQDFALSLGQTGGLSWQVPCESVGPMNFNFGFDNSTTQLQNTTIPLPSPAETASQSLAISTSSWEPSATTQNMPLPQAYLNQSLQSYGMPTPASSDSRRGSIADTLTNNFEGFGIATPQVNLQLSPSVASNTLAAGTDLASRRRRPRPATLTSTALRSRSYGALSAVSPTFRQGIPSASGQTLRHVKSTGHSLYNHYGGIRKPSVPQRSPLNVATFAEANYQQVLAQRQAEMAFEQQLTPTNTLGNVYQPELNHASQSMPPISQYESNLGHSQIQSPPATPYVQDFFLPSQYANLPDGTPPCSAGPMTNSSWSDALTSPELGNFPPVTFIPSISGDGKGCEDPNLNSWTFSAESSPRISTDSKQTQFMVQEFPNQRQEHAQAAQHFSRSRPNHFVFQHLKAEDFAQH